MALTITIPGAVSTTTGSTAPAVLTVGVGSPGVGVPSGGSTGQYLVKASATSYDTAWLTLPANYITSVTAPLAVTSGNLAVNLSAYLTTATAASTYQTIAGMSSYLTSATAATTYAALAGATFNGEVSTPASTTGTAGFSILPGTAPTSPTNGEFWNTGSDLQVRLGGVTETLAEQSWVTSQGFLTSSALTPYAPLAGATFTGLVTTLASATGTAGLNLPHGVAPTSPVNGDIWTTTAGVFARINAGTTQLMNLGSTQTVSGSITFSNASQTLGNSTATGTINVASGATISASTKTLNIGTGGVVGSTTTTILGPVLGASTTTIGATTAASTLNLATGATLTATTKAVNIGTAGVAGSTTNIAIGSTTGTSTTTLQGTTNGITAAVDTNTTQIATTAYVVGQGYAKLASPTLTGTPLAPTATAGTNTTQIATTAFVTAAVPAIATAAQAITGTSATVALSPSTLGAHLTRGFSQRFDFITTTSTSGSGQVTTAFGGLREIYVSSTASAGRASFALGSVGSIGCLSGYSDESKIDYSKKIWVAGRASTNFSATYVGDANTSVSCAIGGFNTNTTGDMNVAGIGWRKAGGSGAFVTLMVHNGTTFTTVATTKTVATLEVFDWLIYSDGTGNVTLYINGVSSATTSSGPTGLGGANQNIYREQCEKTAVATQMLLHSYGGCYYSER